MGEFLRIGGSKRSSLFDGNAHILCPSVFGSIEDPSDLTEDHAHLCHDHYGPLFVKGSEGFQFCLQISAALG